MTEIATEILTNAPQESPRFLGETCEFSNFERILNSAKFTANCARVTESAETLQFDGFQNACDRFLARAARGIDTFLNSYYIYPHFHCLINVNN